MKDDRYVHMLSSNELRTLAAAVDAFGSWVKPASGAVTSGHYRQYVSAVRPWQEMRSAVATLSSHWSDETSMLWLDPSTGTWQTDQADCKPPLCEECSKPIRGDELREYESESGFAAGWPAVCNACAGEG